MLMRAGQMMQLNWDECMQEYGPQKFKSIIESNGLLHDIYETLALIVCEINNQYAYGAYHLIFTPSDESGREYGDDLFRFIAIMATKSNMAYIRLFFDDYGQYSAIPVYQRIMRKKQTGSDSTNGSGSVSLKNSNSPINDSPDVINPTSKSSSSSNSSSQITYNNVTDYDNINETEMRNYYAKLETIVTWIRKNWFDPLIYEYQVNNA